MRAVFLKICFSISLCSLFSVISFAESLKIAYIDLRRAVNEVDEGVSAKNEFQKELQIRQEIFNKKQKEAEIQQSKFEKQNSMMKEDLRKEKLQNLQKTSWEIQQMYGAIRQYMIEQEQEIMVNIVNKMSPIINKLASDGNYAYVLNSVKTNVLYAKPQWDLTNELIRKYNKIYADFKKLSKKEKSS